MERTVLPSATIRIEAVDFKPTDGSDHWRLFWEEGAVLTKAAQKLYLHRNTLQYRLDKWQEMTGLQLKDLNDLAICHQAILGMSI